MKKWLEDAGYEIIAIETYHLPDADFTDVIRGRPTRRPQSPKLIFPNGRTGAGPDQGLAPFACTSRTRLRSPRPATRPPCGQFKRPRFGNSELADVNAENAVSPSTPFRGLSQDAKPSHHPRSQPIALTVKTLHPLAIVETSKVITPT